MKEFFILYENTKISEDFSIEGPAFIKLKNYSNVVIGFISKHIAEVFKNRLKNNNNIISITEIYKEPYLSYFRKNNIRYFLIFDKELLDNYFSSKIDYDKLESMIFEIDF